MKKEIFVSLETAKKLKEVGFDVEVIGSYDLASYGKFMRSGNSKKWNYNAHEYTISAPTLEEAMRWLKQKHNIEVSAFVDGHKQMQSIGGSYLGHKLWCANISELDKPKIEQFGLIWETYDSEEKAIDSAVYKAGQIIAHDLKWKATEVTEVIKFTVTKEGKENTYRVVKENNKYRIQTVTYDGFWKNESDEFWLSIDAIVASSKFQTLFK